MTQSLSATHIILQSYYNPNKVKHVLTLDECVAATNEILAAHEQPLATAAELEYVVVMMEVYLLPSHCAEQIINQRDQA